MGGCRTSGLWSKARVSFCGERGMPGSRNCRREKFPSGIPEGKAAEQDGKSASLSDPCALGRSLPGPDNAFLSGRFLRSCPSCPHIRPQRRPWALSHCLQLVLAPSVTLGRVREPRTETSPFASPDENPGHRLFMHCAETSSNSSIHQGHLFSAGITTSQEAGWGGVGGCVWLILGRRLVPSSRPHDVALVLHLRLAQKPPELPARRPSWQSQK